MSNLETSPAKDLLASSAAQIDSYKKYLEDMANERNSSSKNFE